ncbi:histidine kinase [Chitinophaga skermanii]|uniref:Histidine kinase n=1 Tax=Chitinophaga skermanii TaxID=331697 RepID=A0A327QDS7_9BACT|nr:histidine kinase [Chitinophaga skermanii]
MHILAWLCVFLFPFLFFRVQLPETSFFIREAINMSFMVGLFYLHMYVLIPRFLAFKKFKQYIGSIVAIVMFVMIQQSLVDYYFFGTRGVRPRLMAMRLPEKDEVYYINPKTRQLPPGAKRIWVDSAGRPIVIQPAGWRTGRPHHNRFHGMSDAFASPRDVQPMQPVVTQARPADDGEWHPVTAPGPQNAMFVPAVPASLSPAYPMGEFAIFNRIFWPEVMRRSFLFTLLMLFMSGFIKIVLEWFKSEKQREALKVANLNAELRFLKSQINPHFLFNSLNTIYSLAHKRSDETEGALVKLSSIMRYMIYHANEETVLLKSELRYLEDYISIQRFRVSKEVPITYKISGEAGNLRIEPMLLIPFVENAYKHGISYTERSFIDIDINIYQTTVHLKVKNSLFKQRVAEKGGIGLTNVVKRLELLYEGDHELKIEEHEHQFIVDLKINLKND